MPWGPSFVLVAWRDEGKEQALGIVVVLEDLSVKRGLWRSWIGQGDEASTAVSKLKDD